MTTKPKLFTSQPTVIDVTSRDPMTGELKTSMSAAIDPIVGFGKYHGKRLSQVPKDYLQWLITNQVQLFDRDWAAISAVELRRRETGQSLPTGLQFEEAHWTPGDLVQMVPVDDFSRTKTFKSVPTKTFKSVRVLEQEVEVPLEQEEEASWSPWHQEGELSVMPEVLVDLEQALGQIVASDGNLTAAATYAIDLMREAACYGEVVKETSLIHCVLHKGLEFTFKKTSRGTTLCQLKNLRYQPDVSF